MSRRQWMILVTSLDRKDFPAGDIAALTRLRWRIELAFKRLKSLIRLAGSAGQGRGAGANLSAGPSAAWGPQIKSGASSDRYPGQARAQVCRAPSCSTLPPERKKTLTAWRPLQMLLNRFLQAIMPWPPVQVLCNAAEAIRKRLREPSRKRKLQTAPCLT